MLEDILFCLKYNIKIKYNMYPVCQNHVFILLFPMLATSLALNRPSSGHFIKNLKNAVAFNMNCQYQHEYQYECVSLSILRPLLLEQYHISCAHPMHILPTCDKGAWDIFKWFNYHSNFKRLFNLRPCLQIILSPSTL
jgi:hypothetical protein